MSSTARPGQSRPPESARRDLESTAQLGHNQQRSSDSVAETELAPVPYFSRAMLWQWPLSLFMLIGFSPVMVLIAILIRITSPGPAIYRQTRVGLNGKLFTLYKFRSMHLDAESGTGAVWAKPGDPRVTLLGKITRNLHLDELPQLFNVIRGEMALVGPRPERPEFTAKIEQHIPSFHQRLCIRPGITGLAQVHQGPDVDIDSVRRKLVYDLEYARLGNTWLDWRIMVCTLLRATEFTRTWGIRLLRIPSPSTEMPTSETARAKPPSTAEDGSPRSLDSLQTVSLPQESQQATSNGQHLTNGKHLNGHTPAGKKSAAELSDEDGDGESVPSSHTVARVR